MEDEVALHALQTMIEQFQLCEWGHCCLGKLHCLNHVMHLIIKPVLVLRCSNSAVNVIMGSTEYHDIATQTIREPPLSFTVRTRHFVL
jgi:hypothetical protein